MGNPEKPALRKILTFGKMLIGREKERMKGCKIGGIFAKIAHRSFSKRGALRKWHLKPPS